MPRPDFSGEWRFSSGESRLEIGTPDVVAFRVEHREPAFRLERKFVIGGRSDTFAIDLIVGTEHAPFTRGGAKLYPSLEWDGEHLVFLIRIIRGVEEATNVVRYHLEAEGAVLVAEESFRGPEQSYDNRWVFRKL